MSLSLDLNAPISPGKAVVWTIGGAVVGTAGSYETLSFCDWLSVKLFKRTRPMVQIQAPVVQIQGVPAAPQAQVANS